MMYIVCVWKCMSQLLVCICRWKRCLTVWPSATMHWSWTSLVSGVVTVNMQQLVQYHLISSSLSVSVCVFSCVHVCVCVCDVQRRVQRYRRCWLRSLVRRLFLMSSSVVNTSVSYCYAHTALYELEWRLEWLRLPVSICVNSSWLESGFCVLATIFTLSVFKLAS